MTLKVKRLGDFALFDTSPLTQFSKFDNFLWVCWFLGKNLSNFVPFIWKLHNPYCHNMYWHLSPHKKFSSCLPALKRGVKNGATRKIFGPSYFATALEFWPEETNLSYHYQEFNSIISRKLSFRLIQGERLITACNAS